MFAFMKVTRVTYFILLIITIILGLLSRKVSWLPLATGDALYAVMTYWGFRFLLFRRPYYYSLSCALLFCFGLEFLQLVQHPILVELRSHPILRLIFGQGFLWTDLIAYSLGAVIACLIDKKFIYKNS